MQQRYTDFNAYLRSRFGVRVQKITVDAGLSCPNRDGTIGTAGCLYCNARGSGSGALSRGLSIADQIRQGKERLARRYGAKKFLAYFQSFSNTYAPVATLERIYGEALSIGDVVGLSIGTRPDCVDDAVLDLLTGYTPRHLVWIEYGLQSANDATLVRIHRGHDTARFAAAVERSRARGLPVCAHVILGLPGESRKDMMTTARFIADLGVDGVKIHLLYVVRGTGMERLYRQRQYRCLEQQEYVDLVCDFLERLPPGMIVQRLTGDPHPEELVAPRWALKKQENLALIRQTLEARDTRQGRLFRET